MARYNTVLKKFADAAEDEWEAIVATYRGDLQRGFFEHTQVWIGWQWGFGKLGVWGMGSREVGCEAITATYRGVLCTNTLVRAWGPSMGV